MTPDHTGKTVLLVDDEKQILTFVTRVLKPTGLRILAAQSGAEALEISRTFEGEIHLLLTNIQMDGMTGIELATKISLERTSIDVLLMSGFAQGMLILNDSWHFLHKPFIPAQLLTLVSNALKPSPISDLNEHVD